MPNIITVTEPKRGLQCRILSPLEYRVIRENLSVNHKTIFDAKLFSGMRETEFESFAKNTQWYDRERKIIRLTPKAVKKAKTLFKDRTVNLSTLGAAAIERFIDYKPKVPNRASWNETLKLAATKANVSTTGIEPKMCRKTWEISAGCNISYCDYIHSIITGSHIDNRVTALCRNRFFERRDCGYKTIY